jgi:hypothetical protein
MQWGFLAGTIGIINDQYISHSLREVKHKDDEDNNEHIMSVVCKGGWSSLQWQCLLALFQTNVMRNKIASSIWQRQLGRHQTTTTAIRFVSPPEVGQSVHDRRLK